MKLLRKLGTAAVTCVSLLLAHTASGAAVDYFLTIEGVPGESDGLIQLVSFSFAASNPASVCPGPSGKPAAREASSPSVSEIVVTKITDSATPHLALASATGKPFPKVTLMVIEQDATGLAIPYLVFEMENTLISSYSISSSGDDRPTESITFVYGTISVEYKPQAPGDKPAVAKWDLCVAKK